MKYGIDVPVDPFYTETKVDIIQYASSICYLTREDHSNLNLVKTDKVQNILEKFYILFKPKKYISKVLTHLFNYNLVKPSSGNGLIILAKTKNINPREYVLKTSSSIDADSLIYEYYITQKLNECRLSFYGFPLVLSPIVSKPFFDLKYIDNDVKVSLPTTTINYLSNDKLYLLFEIVKGHDKQSITLNQFVNFPERYLHNNNNNNNSVKDRFEINMINIFIYICIVLQKVQDKYEFTHYDLHTNNVLLYKLKESQKITLTYKNKNYDLLLDYIPFIIDMGRSHIKSVNSTELYKDEDYIKNKTDNNLTNSFRDWETYSKVVWNNVIIGDYVHVKRFKNVENDIVPRINKGEKLSESDKIRYKDYLRLKFIYDRIDVVLKNEHSFNPQLFNLAGIKIDMKYDEKKKRILETYYYNKQEENVKDIPFIDSGISPTEFKPMYDVIRLFHNLFKQLLELNKISTDYLTKINEIFMREYPFVTICNNTPNTKMQKISKYKKPIELVEKLYNDVGELNFKYQQAIQSGGRVDIKIDSKIQNKIDSNFKYTTKTSSPKIMTDIYTKYIKELKRKEKGFLESFSPKELKDLNAISKLQSKSQEELRYTRMPGGKYELVPIEKAY